MRDWYTVQANIVHNYYVLLLRMESLNRKFTSIHVVEHELNNLEQAIIAFIYYKYTDVLLILMSRLFFQECGLSLVTPLDSEPQCFPIDEYPLCLDCNKLWSMRRHMSAVQSPSPIKLPVQHCSSSPA